MVAVLATTLSFGQTNLLTDAGFDNQTIASPGLTSSCNGGVSYSDLTKPERAVAVPSDEWFRCGSKLNVKSDNSNKVLELVDAGSTYARHLLSGLTVGSEYIVKFKAKKSTTTAAPVVLSFKDADDVKTGLNGFLELTATANVDVTAVAFTVNPEALSDSNYTEFAVTFSPIQSNVVLQIGRGKDQGNGSVYLDDIIFTLNTTLSNEANTVVGLSVYPNPASDVVYVSAAEAIESISLVNALGQTVAAPFNGTSVDVAALPHGVYILTVVAGGKSSAQKVLVD